MSKITTHPNFEAFYKDNIGLVHKVARKVHSRTLAIGAAIEYVDLVQEASITMMKAYELFDPTLGFRFSTYYMRAAFNQLNRMVDSYQKDASILGVFSMSAAVNEDGDELNGETTIDGDHPTPEQVLESKQMVDFIQKKLSPLALTILDCMVNPPELLEQEWAASRSMGLTNYVEMSREFVSDYIRKLTGVSAIEIKSARAEISSLSKQLHA